LGNDIRSIHPETWIRCMFAACKCDFLIITDLRYPNEAEVVKRLGGHCVKVSRDDAPVSNDIADTALETYPDWCATVNNNGTLNDLDMEIKRLGKLWFT
jgi:hypothetical protein